MSYFIIVRGPTACGKTTVAEYLSQLLGKGKTDIINLDHRPDIDKVLSITTEHCVAELFYGGRYTRAPETWIPQLEAKGFSIWSIVLRASLDTCLKRHASKGNRTDMDVATVEENYWRYDDPRDERFAEVKNFAWRGQISELMLDADELDAQAIAKRIMECIEAG